MPAAEGQGWDVKTGLQTWKSLASGHVHPTQQNADHGRLSYGPFAPVWAESCLNTALGPMVWPFLGPHLVSYSPGCWSNLCFLGSFSSVGFHKAYGGGQEGHAHTWVITFASPTSINAFFHFKTRVTGPSLGSFTKLSWLCGWHGSGHQHILDCFLPWRRGMTYWNFILLSHCEKQLLDWLLPSSPPWSSWGHNVATPQHCHFQMHFLEPDVTALQLPWTQSHDSPMLYVHLPRISPSRRHHSQPSLPI